jgi:hypothetical protein
VRQWSSFLSLRIDRGVGWGSFRALHHIHVSEGGFNQHEIGRAVAVEPGGRAVAVAAFRDRLAVFPTDPHAVAWRGN